MKFLRSLVQAASEDLSEETQFEYLTQTVGTHLENFYKYNKKDRSDFDVFMGQKKVNKEQVAMDGVALDILLLLDQRMHEMSMKVISELPHSQIELLIKVAV